MSWYEWFGFSSDPFIVTPLQSDEEFNTLFVKTDLVNKELSYISSQVESEPFLLLTIGSRGVGKSTILQYVVNLCRKKGIISVYTGLSSYAVASGREPVYELSRQILKSVIQKLIIEIYINENELFQKYDKPLINWGKRVGLSYDSLEGFYIDPSYQYEFDVLIDILFGIIGIVNKNNMKILIAIDNLDKLDSTIVINFLKSMAQPLLEGLNTSGVSVLIASDPKTAEIIERDVDLSYLRRSIEINPLLPGEAEQLISLRVSRHSRDQEISCYDKRAIFHVCNKKSGITRDILNEVRKLFEKAHSENTKYIDYDMSLEGSKIFDERENYHKVIKDDSPRKGAEKLLSLTYSVPEERKQDIIRYLYGIYEGKRLRIPGTIINEFIKNNIIYTDRSLPRGYNLDLDIYRLFNSLIAIDWSIIDFLKWIFKIDTVKIVRIQTPGSRGYHLVENISKYFKLIDFPNNEISIIINNDDVYYNINDWKVDILTKLRKLNGYFDELTSTDIEDADRKTLLQLTYIILKNYLLIFIKIISAISEGPIRYKGSSDNIDTWRYIWDGIRFYQREYNYWFETFNHINKILNAYGRMTDNSVIPSFSEIEELILHLEDIIIEFSSQLDNLLIDKDLIMKNGTKLSPLNINLIKNQLDEAILNMGYEFDVKIFDDIFENDFSIILDERSFIDDNLLFIRRQTKEINNKEYKGYFICFINKLTTDINRIIMMNYINILTKIVNIIEKNDTKLSLNNRYSVCIFSFNGFEKEATQILKKTIIPMRTNIELLSSLNINPFLKSHNVTEMDSKILMKDYEKDIMAKDEPESHVFILYRAGNKNSEETAKRLSNYLEHKSIKICLFKREVGWADSMTDFEESAIENAFATVICYTKDFKEGKTASEEYRAVLAKRRDDTSFKVGLLLIDCEDEDIPPFMKDYIYAKIENADDEKFDEQAEIIYKGLLDLPIE